MLDTGNVPVYRAMVRTNKMRFVGKFKKGELEQFQHKLLEIGIVIVGVCSTVTIISALLGMTAKNINLKTMITLHLMFYILSFLYSNIKEFVKNTKELTDK